MKKPFLVHVYSTVEGAECVEAPFSQKAVAFEYANAVFQYPDVYKVKVWDLRISEPVPNVTNHPALLLELV